MNNLSQKINVALMLVALSGPAFASLIDFQSLEHEDSTIVLHGFSYAEDGFTLDSFSTPDPFSSFGTTADQYTGSTALFNLFGGITRLTRTGGGAFSVDTIDLAGLSGVGPVTVTFEAYRGVTFLGSQSFTSLGFTWMTETFAFNSLFTAVDRVEWKQIAPYHQFDNILVSEVDTTRIPDSGTTLAMVSLSIIGLGILRRRVHF